MPSFSLWKGLASLLCTLWPDPICAACDALEPTAAYRYTCPYYASLWPDPNCAACGALEPTAAYRYTCSTCADAVAGTSDATSTRNTNTSV